jgi:hypothetical protein
MTIPLTMAEKIQRRGGEYPTKSDWNAVDWSKPQKQIAREMNVRASTVSRQMHLRGVYHPNSRHGKAMELLKEVDASNRRSVAAMRKRGLDVPPDVADLIGRITKFLAIDR